MGATIALLILFIYPQQSPIYAAAPTIEIRIAGQCEYADAPKLSAHKLAVRWTLD